MPRGERRGAVPVPSGPEPVPARPCPAPAAPAPARPRRGAAAGPAARRRGAARESRAPGLCPGCILGARQHGEGRRDRAGRDGQAWWRRGGSLSPRRPPQDPAPATARGPPMDRAGAPADVAGPRRDGAAPASAAPAAPPERPRRREREGSGARAGLELPRLWLAVAGGPGVPWAGDALSPRRGVAGSLGRWGSPRDTWNP